MNNLGAIKLARYDAFFNKSVCFAKAPYYFHYCQLKEGDGFELNESSAASIYVESLSDDCEINLNGEEKLSEGDCLQLGAQALSLKCFKGSANLIISGMGGASSGASDKQIVSKAGIKKVTKPWGYELWISGEHREYCLKKIFIRKGFRTSLQYHEYKHETNVIFSGDAKLHFAQDEISEPEAIDVSGITSIDVPPLSIHRIEAVSDIVIFETSTPELDDVIRLSDDTKRASGRISSEHARV